MEIKRAAEKSAAAADLLRQLERSYPDNIGHWKQGGIVGVRGYGGGVMGRYSDMPGEFPGVTEFHTMRVNHPAGCFYTTEELRKFCDVWDQHGSGLTNLHGSTGDIILLGITTENAIPAFEALAEIGFDLGGSGSVCGRQAAAWGRRAASGPASTPWRHLRPDDALPRRDPSPVVALQVQDQVLRLPERLCAAIARADLSLIGTWRDEIASMTRRWTPTCRGRPGYFRRGDGPLSVVVHGVGRRAELRIDNEGLRPVHALHQPHAEGAPRRPRARRLPPHRRQGARRLGGDALIGPGAVLAHRAALHRVEGAGGEDHRGAGPRKARTANASASSSSGSVLATFLEAIGLPPQPEMVKHPAGKPVLFWDTRGGAENMS